MWDFFYYVFLTLKGVTLFFVIVLLGSGWSSAKAFLSENDKTLLMFLLPTQVIINICIAVLEETSEANWWWSKLLDLFRFLDVLCLLAVLLPLVWSMKNLRDVADQEEKAALTLNRMRLFRTFYLVVVGYIYATRVLLVVIVASLPFTMTWVGAFFKELVAGCLYLYIVNAFKPSDEKNLYEQLENDDDTSAVNNNNNNKFDHQDAHEMKQREELSAPTEIVP
jgi:G protein-coupled receptor 107